VSARAVVDGASVPKLAEHRRLRFDKARDSWTIQAPERAFMLDEIAHAIVSRCDGHASISAIVDELCRLYDDAPREAIEADVVNLIQDFADKGLVTL
jgi:pyrroloquinoline quinone biosynthesis protein D